MIKHLLTILILPFILNLTFSQSLNMDSIGGWIDNTIPQNQYSQTYNDVWGWEQNGREYAVIGSTLGAHIIDVTNPANPIEVDRVIGKYATTSVVHRDFKVFNGHLYMVCDEGPSSLQIADLSYLPDSVHVVYDKDSLLVKSHNIFIDTAKARLYSCGGAKKTGGNDLSIFDVSNPASPVLLIDLKDSITWWRDAVGYVHDIYVKNNIAYVNAEDAMHIIDFTNVNSPLLLGTLSSYPDQGYNHSGWLSEDDTTYVMLDETHGKRLKFLDVSDPSNMQVTDVEGCNTDNTAIAHNGFFKGNLVYTSYYYDGVYVFDATDRNDVKIAGFYDTYQGPSGNGFEGCWGVYPYLPSGNILASDLTKGLIILKLDYSAGVEKNQQESIQLYPNPINSGDRVNFSKKVTYEVYSISGQSLRSKQEGTGFSTAQLPTGYYFVKINNTFTKLIVK